MDSSKSDEAARSSPWPLDRADYSLRLRTTLPSTKQALNDAVGRVLAVADDCGCVEDRRADLEIALREALANAIIHGNSYHRQKRIYLRCYGAPQGRLLVLVRDEGDGFEPEEIPDPRGDRTASSSITAAASSSCAPSWTTSNTANPAARSSSTPALVERVRSSVRSLEKGWGCDVG